MPTRPTPVTTETFDRQVLASPVPVLVDFHADWCAPCRAVGPVVEELAREYEGRVHVAKVDIDANDDLALRYALVSIPTLIVFEGGEEADRIVGAAPKATIAARLDAVLGDRLTAAAS